ncbi:ATP-binding protein [Synechococcus sp. CCY9202]|uniref:ATP-binding protein n=1 Tax=Synechococcus sp. CCY9202 TaxID=174698 RepID=UPI002B20B047|nr:ATP-binding protein [Synechococcus sp. CCY9202]MEA5423543.1 ATP-binding protein [Synechococcus sp. CCY9202]
MTAPPPPDNLALEIGADPLEFRRASAWLQQSGAALAMPEEQIDRLELCLNEVLANLVEHGGEAAAQHPIQLRLQALQPTGACGAELVVSDRGAPFDSSQASSKPIPGSLEEATPGGLGLRLVKAFSDEMSYRMLDGHNELRIVMHWSPDS